MKFHIFRLFNKKGQCVCDIRPGWNWYCLWDILKTN